MNQISDYTDDPSVHTSNFKQNFDLVSPEEIQYFSESLAHDFEELDRKSFIFGLQIPKKVVELQKWMEENLHPSLQVAVQEPTFFHECLVIRKVNWKVAKISPCEGRTQCGANRLWPCHPYLPFFLLFLNYTLSVKFSSDLNQMEINNFLCPFLSAGWKRSDGGSIQQQEFDCGNSLFDYNSSHLRRSGGEQRDLGEASWEFLSFGNILNEILHPDSAHAHC